MTDEAPAGIALPRGWAAIPLTPDGVRVRAVAAVIRRQFAGSSAAPGLRHEMQRALAGVTKDAARAGGVFMAFDLGAVSTAALPVALTVFRPSPAVSMEALMRTHATTPSAVIAQGLAGPVLRVDRVEASTEVSGARSVPQLRVDYWLEPGDGLGVYHAAFSSALVHMREPLLDLFDAMVSSVGAPDVDGEVVLGTRAE